MTYQRILVAIDDSEPAERALDAALDLTRGLHARILLVHVVNPAIPFLPGADELSPLDVIADLRARGEDLLLRTRMRSAGVEPIESALLEGHVAEEIVSASVEWEADLIVIGTHGRGRIGALLLGSTAQEVIRQARCPMMTVSDNHAVAGARAEEARWLQL
jgi:nucleotide-binding universal stress UspA family protein